MYLKSFSKYYLTGNYDLCLQEETHLYIMKS